MDFAADELLIYNIYQSYTYLNASLMTLGQTATTKELMQEFLIMKTNHSIELHQKSTN
jgi:hypothetical protein